MGPTVRPALEERLRDQRGESACESDLSRSEGAVLLVRENEQRGAGARAGLHMERREHAELAPTGAPLPRLPPLGDALDVEDRGRGALQDTLEERARAELDVLEGP